ncbi:hypothetical protein NBRC116593_09300 [Sulfitobacter pacificus]
MALPLGSRQSGGITDVKMGLNPSADRVNGMAMGKGGVMGLRAPLISTLQF